MTIRSVMKHIGQLLWPRTLASQLIILMVSAILLAQIISLFIFHDERRIAFVASARDNLLARAVSLTELMDETPLDLQDRILAASNSRFAVFWLGQTPLAPSPGKTRFEKRLQQYVSDELRKSRSVHINIHADERRGPSRWREDSKKDKPSWRNVPKAERPANLRKVMNKPRDFTLSIQMEDGRWMNVATSYRPPSGSLIPLLVQLTLTLCLTALIIGLAVRRVTKPLKDLASGAEKFGRGEDISPLPASGPTEIQTLTSSFNDMQARLSRFVKDRTRMLAAISHDLRTPITSLRIRAEFIEDDENREKIVETLDEMAAMTEATLRFAKEEAHNETAETIDLVSMLEGLTKDQQELGHACRLTTTKPILVACRPLALKRAFRNLIGNGIRYGQSVSISIEKEAHEAVIKIQDKGPGIPENQLKDVFEPFIRLEDSRNEDTGGIGLGLSITRSLIHAHGGEIELRNLPEGGLVAEVRLPHSSR